MCQPDVGMEMSSNQGNHFHFHSLLRARQQYEGREQQRSCFLGSGSGKTKGKEYSRLHVSSLIAKMICEVSTMP